MPVSVDLRNCRRRRVVATALLVTAGFAAAACSSQPSVRSEWTERPATGAPFQRVLIVGVAPDYNQRCAFEYALLSQLRSANTAAFASCDSMRSDEALTREAVERVVAARDADAVVATTLVASKRSAQEGGTRDTRGYAGYKAVDSGIAYGPYGGFYGPYGVPVVYGEFERMPSVFTLSGDVTVGSRVFATEGAKAVYSLETQARNLESRNTATLTLAVAISDRMRKDAVVR